MKLRAMPIAAAAAVSAALLFGGWTIYSNVATVSPLETIASGVPGVEQAHIKVGGDRVNVQLQLAPQASLREVVAKLRSDGGKQIDGRELAVTVNNPASDKLEKWWATVLFDVAQAMETKRFSDIPAKLAAAAEGKGISVRAEMDDDYVYVTLVDENGGGSKFVMLPRVPAQLEAWGR
jgi:hypothetical protein